MWTEGLKLLIFKTKQAPLSGGNLVKLSSQGKKIICLFQPNISREERETLITIIKFLKINVVKKNVVVFFLVYFSIDKEISSSQVTEKERLPFSEVSESWQWSLSPNGKVRILIGLGKIHKLYQCIETVERHFVRKFL